MGDAMVVGQQICRDHDGDKLETKKPCGKIHTRESRQTRQDRHRETDGWTGRLTRAVCPVNYSLSQSIFLFFSLLSFLPSSFLRRSEQRCPYPASWEGGVRACACVCVGAEQEQAWQVQCTVRCTPRSDGMGKEPLSTPT